MPKTRLRLPGEGHARQRPDGRWEVQVSLGFDYRGKRDRKSAYGKTPEEALKNAATIRARHQRGVVSGGATVAEYLASWLETKALEVEPVTISHYRKDAARYLVPRLGRVPLDKLSTRQIKLWQARLAEDCGPYTANRARSLLGNAMNDAVSEGLLMFNPAAPVRGVKHTPKRIQIWSAAHIEAALAAAAGTRFLPLMVVALSTGLRLGELLGLMWSRVRFYDAPTVAETGDWGELKVDVAALMIDNCSRLGTPKTPGSFRDLGFDEETAGVLVAQRKRLGYEAAAVRGYVNNDLVFPSGRGTLQNQSNVHRDMDKVLAACNPRLIAWLEGVKAELMAGGLSQKAAKEEAKKRLAHEPGLRESLTDVPYITFHDLRHTHASMLIAAGVDPVDVSRRLGHESVAFTMRTYAHFFERQRRRASKSLSALTGRSLFGGGTGGGTFIGERGSRE